MASQITATLPTLDFPKEVDYPTQEDWAAFSAAAEENFGILGGSWSTQMQLWKTEANAMSTELNNSADIAQGLANYQGDWVSQGYTLGQTVSVGEVYYICKLTHATGQNPTDVSSLYWNLALGNWNLKVDANMSGYTSKATPVDADLIPLSDSAASFGIKKLSWSNLKATLKTYFDTLYQSVSKIAYNATTSTYIDNTLSSGAIIERGSNVSGEYVKYADGTLITSGSIVVASSNNNGNIYTFPHAFASSPKAIAQANRIQSGGSGGSVVTEMRDATTSLVYVKALVHGPTTITDIASCEINVNAIGRWK